MSEQKTKVKAGQGGFGQVFLATRLRRSTIVPETVCIEVSPRIDGWLREAYFGQLLDGHPRAIRLFDVFPLMQADGQVLYYLVLEYAEHGDLSAYLHGSEKGWSEHAVRREGGLKLMEIKRLREKGHRITLLNETQFWRLAGKR